MIAIQNGAISRKETRIGCRMKHPVIDGGAGRKDRTKPPGTFTRDDKRGWNDWRKRRRTLAADRNRYAPARVRCSIWNVKSSSCCGDEFLLAALSRCSSRQRRETNRGACSDRQILRVPSRCPAATPTSLNQSPVAITASHRKKFDGDPQANGIWRVRVYDVGRTEKIGRRSRRPIMLCASVQDPSMLAGRRSVLPILEFAYAR